MKASDDLVRVVVCNVTQQGTFLGASMSDFKAHSPGWGLGQSLLMGAGKRSPDGGPDGFSQE